MNIKFNHGFVWNLLGGAIPAIVALVSVPLLLMILGVNRFTLVSLMISIFLFLMVFDFGFARTLHYYQGQAITASDKSKNIAYTLILSGVFAVVSSLIIWGVSPWFINNWLEIPEDNIQDAIMAFKILAIAVIPSVLTHIHKGVMEQNASFKAVNLSKIISVTSLFLTSLLVAVLSDSLIVLAWGILFSRLLSFFVYYYLSGVRLDITKFCSEINFRFMASLTKYIALVGFAGFVSAAFVYGDRFFVSGYLSSSDYSIYVLSQDFISRYLLIPWSLAMTLIPFMAKTANSHDRWFNILKAYKNTIFISIGFFVVTLFFILTVLPYFIAGSVLDKSQVIATTILVGVIFGAFAQIPLVCLFALGKIRLLSWVFFFELLLYFVCAPIFMQSFGLMGAASIWTLRLIIECSALNYFFLRSERV